MEDKHNLNIKKWNLERILSICAISVSVFTFIVLIYQSRLLNNQFQLAQKQQYASVLPYLEIGPSSGHDYFRIILGNTGIGPAFIKDVYLYFEDEKHQLDPYGFILEFSNKQDSIFNLVYSSLYPGRVIQAGSDITLLSTEGSHRNAEKLREFLFSKESLVFVIEYASVYDERWILESLYPPKPITKEEYLQRVDNKN